MVGTAEDFGSSFSLGHHRGGMMAADIEESAQNIVVTPDDENRLAGYLASDVLTRKANLLGAPEHMPRARENSATF
jgi:hypothetical protein